MNFTSVEAKYCPALSKAFSPSVLNDLADHKKSAYLSEVISNSHISLDPKSTLKNFYKSLYAYLSKHYVNEYIYKNVLAEQVFLGKHKLDEARMFTEFRASTCKADVLILNGTSTVYEIKSEYDNLDRLESQIGAYTKLFDKIYVVTVPKQVDKIKDLLSNDIGIMILQDYCKVDEARPAQSQKENIDQASIFDSLRRSEYVAIVEKYYRVPEVPNTQIYSKCKKLFCKLPPDVAHNEMVATLHKRDNGHLLKDFINKIPDYLKGYAVSSKPNFGLLKILDSKITALGLS